MTQSLRRTAESSSFAHVRFLYRIARTYYSVRRLCGQLMVKCSNAWRTDFLCRYVLPLGGNCREGGSDEN